MAKSSLSKRFSAVCLPCVCLLGASLAAAEQPRPNILLIITDQQSATMMSCTGNAWLETPARAYRRRLTEAFRSRHVSH